MPHFPRNERQVLGEKSDVEGSMGQACPTTTTCGLIETLKIYIPAQSHNPVSQIPDSERPSAEYQLCLITNRACQVTSSTALSPPNPSQYVLPHLALLLLSGLALVVDAPGAAFALGENTTLEVSAVAGRVVPAGAGERIGGGVAAGVVVVTVPAHGCL